MQKKREMEEMARAAEAARDEEYEGSASPVAPVVEELVGDDFTRRTFGAEAVVVTTRFGLDEDGDGAGADGTSPDVAALEELASHAPPRRPRPEKGGAGGGAAAAGVSGRHRPGGSGRGRGRGGARGGSLRGGSRGRARGGFGGGDHSR